MISLKAFYLLNTCVCGFICPLNFVLTLLSSEILPDIDKATLQWKKFCLQMAAQGQEEKFFKETKEPQNFIETKALIQNFVEKHLENGSRIVLVTVGHKTIKI